MEVIGKQHTALAIVLFVLYGVLTYFERQIILSSNTTPALLVLLYLLAGLISVILAVNFYLAAKRRIRNNRFDKDFFETHSFVVTVIFLVIVGAIRLLTIWLQLKFNLPRFALQTQVMKQSGLELWAFRLFFVVFVPLIQQCLFNGFFFNELFYRSQKLQVWGLVFMAITGGLFNAQPLNLLLGVPMVLGVLYGLCYLNARNIVAPTLVQMVGNLIFVVLYA